VNSENIQILAASIKTVCSRIREKYQGIDKTSLARQLEQTTEIPDVRNRLRETGNEHEGQTEFLPLLGESSLLSEFVGTYGLISDIMGCASLRSSICNLPLLKFIPRQPFENHGRLRRRDFAYRAIANLFGPREGLNLS
jgi:hypothetical protein